MSENTPHKSCAEAVVRIEKSFWQKLNFIDAVKLKFHLMICKNCSDYKKDSSVLHRILCTFKAASSTEHLHYTDKEKLKNALKG